MKVKTKVTLYTIALVISMGAVLGGAVYYSVSETFYLQMRTDVDNRMRVAWDLLQRRGTPFHVKNDRLMAGDVVLNGDQAFVDQVSDLLGGTAAIFQDDTRIATNIRLPDGSRAIGTKLSGPARQVLFQAGKNYRGDLNILGEPYLTAYELIKDPSGKTIGILQVGTKKTVYDNVLSAILWRSLMITVAGGLIVSLMVYLALSNLTEEIQRISHNRRLLLESTSEGIYGIDMDGRCTFINPAGAQMLGYELNELMGKEMHPTIHHSHWDGTPYPLNECRLCQSFTDGKERQNDSGMFWRKDGQRLPSKYISSPVIDEKGVHGAVVVFNLSKP
jgi:PAS domain S-box-containing protein